MSFADERQHEFLSVVDRPGSLDSALTSFARRGRRVLNFWRSHRRWVFKLMVKGRLEVERE